MNKTFIQKIQDPNILKYLIDDHDVVLIYLGGSRAFGIVDNYSDYDIVVITKKKYVKKEGRYGLEYNGSKVHWYYMTLEDLILPVTEVWEPLDAISAVNLYTIKENIIYTNPKYENEVNFILNNSLEIAKNGCWNFILFNTFFDKLCEEKEVTHKNKFTYHFCTHYSILFNKPLDRDFLNNVKRNLQNKEDACRIIKIVLELKEFSEEHKEEILKQRHILWNKLKEV